MSIRNIAAKVEYSPGAIYSYFPSKDEIFFALAEEGFRQIGARSSQHAPSDDPLDDVRATAWRLYEFSKEQPQYFALVFLDRHVPRVGREYERFSFISDIGAGSSRRCSAASTDGLFPGDGDAEVALRLLLAPILGIAALRLSNDCPTRTRTPSCATRSRRRSPAFAPERLLGAGRRASATRPLIPRPCTPRAA